MNRMQSRLAKLEKASPANLPELPDAIWLRAAHPSENGPVEGDSILLWRNPNAKGAAVDE